VEAHGLEGFGQAHRWRDGGEPPRQHPGADLTLACLLLTLCLMLGVKRTRKLNQSGSPVAVPVRL
jgi:hypothetical protein